MITFDRKKKAFHLKAGTFSYVLGVAPTGDLQHLHWGAPLSAARFGKLLANWAKTPVEDGHHISLEKHQREYADFGHNDLRTPAFHLEHADGTRISEFKFLSHSILSGKPDFGPGPS